MEDISETPPKDINPYATLNLTPSASAAEVRTAYKKLALKHHPDKVDPSQKSTAHNTFQKIAFAYAILSSPHRRTLYDTTGSTSETLSSLSDNDNFNWLSFFRTQYSAISTSTLSDFSASYKSSTEERKDLLAAYSQHEGRMNKIYEVVMLSNPLDDEDRFREIIDDAIEKGKVEGYKAYVKEPQHSRTARMKKAKREAEYAEQQRADSKYKSIFGGDGKGASEVDGSAVDVGGRDADVEGGEPLTNQEKKSMRGHGDLDNLAAMIQSRDKTRGETFLDSLEAKYAGASTRGKGTKRKAEEEPNEDSFQKTRAKLAKAKNDRQEKAKPNGKAGKELKAASQIRKAEGDVEEEEEEEEEEEQEEEDVDLEEKSDDEHDEVMSEDVSEKEVQPKAKPKWKAKAPKGQAKKATAPAAKRNTRSRVKQ
ncbi:MAG: hypothetical protein Q9182_003327 [Xanthomendoza sp. 2 TL-2023]